MRTVMLSIVLSALVLALIGEINKDKAGLTKPSEPAELSLNFAEFRMAAMSYVSTLTREQRTALIGSHGAVQLDEENVKAFLPSDWEMPDNGSGDAAWQAWLAVYTDSSNPDAAVSGDYFGAGHAAHCILWIVSMAEDQDDMALALAAGKALDWPRGLGLACTDFSEGIDSCRKTSYGGMGVPAASKGGAVPFREGGIVSASIYERAPREGDAYSEYGG